MPEEEGPILNFAKWRRVIDAERELSSFSAAGLTRWPAEEAAAWRALRASLADAPQAQRLEGVNAFFNRKSFREDQDVWGVSDYWATPAQFMRRSGDCEDYAVAKYYALRDLGLPAEDLRLAGVLDSSRSRAQHALLLVRGENGWLTLDNLRPQILPFEAGVPYIPVYLTNEERLWRRAGTK